MRLSRRALAVLGGAAGIAVAGALIYALLPAHPTRAQNVYQAGGLGHAGPLAGSAADYSAFPELAPPRPADLETPAGEAGGGAEAGSPAGRHSPPAIAGPEADVRLRAEQEGYAARASRLFLGGGSAPAAPVALGPSAPREEGSSVSGQVPNERHGAFLAPRAVSAESGSRLHGPSSPRILQAGSIIPAALITAVHSDLPGQVTAQVTQNVYDSPTGNLLLVPQGARLIGEYSSELVAGQSRLLLAWDRLIFPGGRSLELGRLPGGDASGKAGIADRTDYHWGQVMRAALVSALLGVGAELGADSDDRLMRALRDSGQDTINQTGRRLVERQAAIPPTVTVRPGAPVRVIVTRDLVFEADTGA